MEFKNIATTHDILDPRESRLEYSDRSRSGNIEEEISGLADGEERPSLNTNRSQESNHPPILVSLYICVIGEWVDSSRISRVYIGLIASMNYERS
jgi:hypothetical protein